ncbi:MAG: hypothetical protein EA400_02515 [Chromatiaceae bacterium]|nr:MAG: hypothetical protein EA400_02515 [Chromatiaceae bacterium]
MAMGSQPPPEKAYQVSGARGSAQAAAEMPGMASVALRQHALQVARRTVDQRIAAEVKQWAA